MKLDRLFREPLILWESQDYASIFNPLKKLVPPDFSWAYATQNVEAARRTLRRADRIAWWLRWFRLSLVEDMIQNNVPGITQDVLDRLLDDMSRKAGRTVGTEDMTTTGTLEMMRDTHLAHFLSLPVPAIQNYAFGFQTVEEVLNDFEQFEAEWQEQAGEETDPRRSFAFDPALAAGETVLVAFPDGSEWIDLGRAACDREADAMTHCGNRPRKDTDDRLLSLRRYVELPDSAPVRRKGAGFVRDDTGGPADRVAVVPMLTFVLDGRGMLGEMKGPKNNKPGARHRAHIVALLRHPLVRGITDGHWRPGNDFKMSWLDAATQDALWNEKPSLFQRDDLATFLLRRTDIALDDAVVAKLSPLSTAAILEKRTGQSPSDAALDHIRDGLTPAHITRFLAARPDLTVGQRLRIIKDGATAFAVLLASPGVEITGELAKKLADIPATKMRALMGSHEHSRESLANLAEHDDDFLNYVPTRWLDQELAEIAARKTSVAERIRKRIPARLQNREVLRSYWNTVAWTNFRVKLTDIPPDLLTPDAASVILTRMVASDDIDPSGFEAALPPDVWKSTEVQRLYWSTRASREHDLRPEEIEDLDHADDWTILTLASRNPSSIPRLYAAGRLDPQTAWRIMTQSTTNNAGPGTAPNLRTLPACPVEMVRNHPHAARIERMLAEVVIRGYNASANNYQGQMPALRAARELLRVFGRDLSPLSVDALVMARLADADTLPEGSLERTDLSPQTRALLAVTAASWSRLARLWPNLQQNKRSRGLAMLAASTGRMRLDLLPFDRDRDARTVQDALTIMERFDLRDRGILRDLEKAGIASADLRRRLAAIGLVPVRDLTPDEMKIAFAAWDHMLGLNRRVRNHPEEMAALPLEQQRRLADIVVWIPDLWRHADPRAANDVLVRAAIQAWRAKKKPELFHSAEREAMAEKAPSDEELRRWLALVPRGNLSAGMIEHAEFFGFSVGGDVDA